MELEGAARIARLLSVRLVGKIAVSPGRGPVFQRRVSRYPALRAVVTTVTNADLLAVYARPTVPSIRIGPARDQRSAARVSHGRRTAGQTFRHRRLDRRGKSCAVTLLLSEILADQPNAHVILLDPHNEYAAALGDLAEVVNLSSSHLPYWILNHQEMVRKSDSVRPYLQLGPAVHRGRAARHRSDDVGKSPEPARPGGYHLRRSGLASDARSLR